MFGTGGSMGTGFAVSPHSTVYVAMPAVSLTVPGPEIDIPAPIADAGRASRIPHARMSLRTNVTIRVSMRSLHLGSQKAGEAAVSGRMSESSERLNEQPAQLGRGRRPAGRVSDRRVQEHGLDDFVEPVLRHAQLAEPRYPRAGGEPRE